VRATSDTVAEQRATTPRALVRDVRSDLDWIVLKALEKDRERRYQTASALADDIEHTWNHEPVAACPPTAACRLRKFVRRNALWLGTAVVRDSLRETSKSCSRRLRGASHPSPVAMGWLPSRTPTVAAVLLAAVALWLMSDVTQVLRRIEQGDAAAAGQLLPLVYDELRKLAVSRMARENPGQTLQATALVHEAYLRLVDMDQAQHWDGRGHFFAAAAEAMRRILVENARRKGRVKHGGDLARLDINHVPVVAPEIHEDLMALDAALDRLKVVDAQAVQLVHLRYFVGLSIPDAAHMMGIAPRTADRIWAFARAWLHQEIAGTEADPEKI